MDSIFLPLQNFTAVSFIAFGFVLMSLFIETQSNSPYKSLLLSNIAFGIYNFTAMSGSEIDFPIYFMVVSFLTCSWFFVLKNIEEEEDEDRGYLRTDYSFNSNGFDSIESKNVDEVSVLSKTSFSIFPIILRNVSSRIFENKVLLFVRVLFKNDKVHYKHPQRKFVHAFTYLILLAILVSFFYV